MTWLDALLLAGSAVGVALMVGLAWLLGFRGRARITAPDQMHAALAAYDPEARAEEIALDAHGKCALARLTDGRIAALRVVGDRMALRVFPLTAVRSVRLRRPHGQPVVRVAFADVGFASLSVTLDQPEPPQWVEAVRHATRSA